MIEFHDWVRDEIATAVGPERLATAKAALDDALRHSQDEPCCPDCPTYADDEEHA